MKSITFRFQGKKIEIIDRPLTWMSQDELAALQQRLRTVAAARFGYEPRYSYFSDTRFFADKVIVICSDANGERDHCFCAMCHLGEHAGRAAIHLGSVFSASENKGYLNYLYTFGLIFVAFKNGLLKKIYVTSLTHTPKIFGIVSDGFENVFPDANPDKAPSATHLALRDRLIHHYIEKEWNLPEPVSCQDNFVIPSLRRQADGEIMFPDTAETVPKYRSEQVNQRLLSLLDYQRGDEILQVGELWVPYSLPKKIFNVFKNAAKAPRARVPATATAKPAWLDPAQPQA